ncbi:MAG: hypothetical protein K2X82_24595, partial [Gemmataceae bacterium]|nr:hypothetical protein [Gemmataceae bacterium]
GPGRRPGPPAARWQGELRTEAVAWVAAGGLIFLAFLYIGWFHWRWVQGLDDHEWGVRAVIALGVIGVFAAGKGVYMLARGSYPEHDGW